MRWTRLLAGLSLVLGAGCRFTGPGNPDLPYDYRDFALVSTRTSTDDADPHPGVLIVFASGEAAEANRRRGPYPAGSAVVAVGHAPRSEDGVVRPGARRTIWLMRKGEDAWRFSAYGGETLKKERVDPQACAGCHAEAAATDHVFTRWLD